MKFEQLPHVPEIWMRFINAQLPLPPGPRDRERLPAIADAVRCRDRCVPELPADSVAVVASFYVSLLGGPVAQILKCLTAIRLCRDLAGMGIAATPVCWIDYDPPAGVDPWVLNLLDATAGLHRMAWPSDSRNSLQACGFSAVLSDIEAMGAGRFDGEAMRMLQEAFHPQATHASANARWVAALLKEWEMRVLDPEAPPVLEHVKEIRLRIQAHAAAGDGARLADNAADPGLRSCLEKSLALPVAAFVVDAWEIPAYMGALPLWDAHGVPRPLLWPQASATLYDSRNRRMLERYGVDPPQLYEGEAEVAGRLRAAMHTEVPGELQQLQAEADSVLTAIDVPDALDKRFARIRNSCRTRILYQLGKLRTQAAAALAIREQTALRRLRRACNFLAPNGRLQERELGGIQIPLIYGCGGLRMLYDRLDIHNMHHQWIEMD